ncbi:MAG: tryptophan synthase subunit beta [Candidatus Avelusimicrobium sp.]|uniref:tryptophan synthase subunit beta n=1 Tax=Candidatus Avelusimicrobium sp. TaxID=3048833 RepID=UPI003EFFD001
MNTNQEGYFGPFGGCYLPENLTAEMRRVAEAYRRLKADPAFWRELSYIRKHYQGRPTPVTFAKGLTAQTGGAQIYLKREDLNHTGAHKINHCIGEALLAVKMGKKKLLAETGAGQHGVALATAAAYFGLECEIHMGAVDVEKEKPNVTRMRLLGAKIVPVTFGQQSLKEAVDSAFETYSKEYETALYCIGSVVGPHPFPTLVRDFQSVIGAEARGQMLEMTGSLPNHVVACVGGGSNAMGIFSGFLEDASVKLYGVEPLGRGGEPGNHAASLSYGTPGILHGFKSILLQDASGGPAPVYSVASGLDYPGVGPEHAYLKSIGRVTYDTVGDAEALDAFYTLCKTDGIIPALESAHAVAYGVRLAKKLPPEETVLVNLSGRGDKDIDFIVSKFGVR